MVEKTIICDWLGYEINVFGSSEFVSEGYIDYCVKFLNCLSKDIIADVINALVIYRNDMIACTGDFFLLGKFVMDEVYITSMRVDDPIDVHIPAICLLGSCEWEPEHGIEIDILGDRLAYVGDYTGNSPWSDFGKLNYNYAKISER